jgi:hypothetical protein
MAPVAQVGVIAFYLSFYDYLAQVAVSGGVTCENLMDSYHSRKFSHDVLNPCEDAHCCPLTYNDERAEVHMKEFSHPCRNGMQCTKSKDKEHCRAFYHLKRLQCTDVNCALKADWKHRETFSHKNLPDFLVPCMVKQFDFFLL